MESSDDENEHLPEFVSNYYFLDDNGEPISFAVLPISWNMNETVQSKKKQIDLHGTTDGGLQKFYKPVKAWKFDISGEEPEISVLSTDNIWIKVQKPRKSYQETIRSVLITVNFLHLVKKDPELNRKAVGSKLSQIFSLYDDRPSQKDLVRHKMLIEEAVKQDGSLKKSEYLVMLLEKKQQRIERTDEDTLTKEKKDFIVDDDEEEDEEDDASGDEEDNASEEGDEEPFDSVCCICDNGGTLLCCEGVCMRSFHATRKAAKEAQSLCASLGLSTKEVKDIPNFKCKNCQYKQHQCYSCGQLGSSDKSLGAEVFQCANATCGYFYHPRCVTKLLHRDNEAAAKELQDKILAGESFACPLHICFSCKQPEDKTIPELQMAVCRRCPKAYHEKCLPKKFAFEENEDEGIIQRAWRDLLVDRILIYCLKHEIDEDLGTPARNHIKFPGDEKKEKQSSASVLTKDAASQKKKKLPIAASSPSGSVIQSKKNNAQVGNLDKRTSIKTSKTKVPDIPRKTSIEKKPILTKKSGSSVTEKNKASLGDALHALYTRADLLKPSKPEKLDEDELSKTSKPVLETLESQLDSDSERRILEIMKEASSIITMDDIILKHEKAIPSRAYKYKMDLKNITQGKVEVSCKAVRAASKKLEGGGNIEDAKNICDSKVLNQVVKWKSKLRIYLSPFLNGMRYTSYGRHFTKVDKLKEIVDKIHWYVNSGDTIVDFCCGANDFSWLMKQKLEQTGKNCSYKNFDLFRPKNDFCFEKRDWLDAKPSTLRLPTGSQLIMGLNPPFGVRAALANQFIDKALEFKPKLLILIVPSETERLDKKSTPYDLVWEDYEKLSGKSFYLPGSVDINDQQMEDWNKVPPVLYLWSRTDWTAKHKTIAEKHGHVKTEKRQVHHSPVNNQVHSNDVVVEVDGFQQDVPPEGLKEKVAGRADDTLENRSAHGDHGENIPSRFGKQGKKKRKQREEKQRTNDSEHKQKQAFPRNPHHVRPRLSSPSKPHHSEPLHFPDPTLDGRRSQEHSSSLRQRTPSDMDIDDSSFDPHVEKPAHTTGYDAAAYGRASSLDVPREVDPIVEPSQPTSYDATAYGRSHNYYRERIGHYALPEADASVEGTQPTSFDAAVYGRAHDRYQASHYRERIDTYTAPEADPFSTRRERWPMDDASRSGAVTPGYTREAQDFGFNQPSQIDTEPTYRSSSYSMGSTYSRMNSMPVSERYALRLDDRNPLMARDAGGGTGTFDYHGLRPRHASDHMGFAAGPVNYYPPHNGPRGGWLNE